jgi:hypothetical protein
MIADAGEVDQRAPLRLVEVTADIFSPKPSTRFCAFSISG